MSRLGGPKSIHATASGSVRFTGRKRAYQKGMTPARAWERAKELAFAYKCVAFRLGFDGRVKERIDYREKDA